MINPGVYLVMRISSISSVSSGRSYLPCLVFCPTNSVLLGRSRQAETMDISGVTPTRTVNCLKEAIDCCCRKLSLFFKSVVRNGSRFFCYQAIRLLFPWESSFTLQRDLKCMDHLVNLKVFGSLAACSGIVEMEN